MIAVAVFLGGSCWIHMSGKSTKTKEVRVQTVESVCCTETQKVPPSYEVTIIFNKLQQ